jgi:hypothetical protein
VTLSSGVFPLTVTASSSTGLSMDLSIPDLLQSDLSSASPTARRSISPCCREPAVLRNRRASMTSWDPLPRLAARR